MTVSAPLQQPLATGWPRGHLRPCLLLLIAEQPSHGYDLLDRLESLGTPPIDAGTLYRNLRAMERDETVASSWEVSPSGPARRTYRITDRGRAELEEWASLLTASVRTIEEYVERCRALTPHEGARASAR